LRAKKIKPMMTSTGSSGNEQPATAAASDEIAAMKAETGVCSDSGGT
jgi:hypothetical protein